MAALQSHVVHPLVPIYSSESRVLVLGTMPSPASREAGFYYANPRNRFWPVMARLFGVADPGDAPGRTRLVLEHRIALWDVLASCDIEGAADSSIAHPVANDIAGLLGRTSIERVFTTGATAFNLYQRLCASETHIDAQRLPSTSPANASWSLDRLVESYREILAYL